VRGNSFISLVALRPKDSTLFRGWRAQRNAVTKGIAADGGGASHKAQMLAHPLIPLGDGGLPRRRFLGTPRAPADDLHV